MVIHTAVAKANDIGCRFTVTKLIVENNRD